MPFPTQLIVFVLITICIQILLLFEVLFYHILNIPEYIMYSTNIMISVANLNVYQPYSG